MIRDLLIASAVFELMVDERCIRYPDLFSFRYLNPYYRILKEKK